MTLQIEVSVVVTQNKNVRDLVSKLTAAVVDAVGPDFTGQLRVEVNVHKGSAKVKIGAEETVAA